MSGVRILVADDEPAMALAIGKVLEREGFRVDRASDGLEALAAFSRRPYPVVVTDVRMPRCDGVELLARILARAPETAVVLVTAFGTVEDAVDAVKRGAFDYVLKPFAPEVLVRTVRAALEKRTEAASPEARCGPALEAPEIITADPALGLVLEQARRAAAVDATVLLQAESGTGKELLARFIHAGSPRAGGPFVALNCAALPESLLESELFGVMRGAYTGAERDRKGHFERASGGTLLLDEVGECPRSLQAKLLRVLEEQQVLRLGGDGPVPIDVRLVAATNRDLRREVQEGRFREDLFYRLQVIPLRIPPLRERPGDIALLARHFCRLYSTFATSEPTLSDEAAAALAAHRWPGNVRELENVIQRALVLSLDAVIRPDDLFLDESPGVERVESQGLPVGIPLDVVERRLIERTLERTGGNRTRASEMLGISVRTLRNKLRRYREEAVHGLG